VFESQRETSSARVSTAAIGAGRGYSGSLTGSASSQEEIIDEGGKEKVGSHQASRGGPNSTALHLEEPWWMLLSLLGV